MPEWVELYSLPAEASIVAEIALMEQERQDLEQRISEARSRAREAARPRLLLYASGEDDLEPIVRETLRLLGGRVDNPESKGIEDGRLFRDE